MEEEEKGNLDTWLLSGSLPYKLQSNDNDLETENFAVLFVSNYCDYMSLNSTFVGVPKEDIYIFCDDGYKDRTNMKKK